MMNTILVILIVSIPSIFVGMYYERYKIAKKSHNPVLQERIKEAQILATQYLWMHSKKIMRRCNYKNIAQLLEMYWYEGFFRSNNSVDIDPKLLAQFIINKHYNEVFINE